MILGALYGCETWFSHFWGTIRILNVWERVVRRITGPQKDVIWVEKKITTVSVCIFRLVFLHWWGQVQTEGNTLRRWKKIHKNYGQKTSKEETNVGTWTPTVRGQELFDWCSSNLCVKLSSYVTENTACFHQKDQSVNVVQRRKCCLLQQSHDFKTLQQVVHAVTTGDWSVTLDITGVCEGSDRAWTVFCSSNAGLVDSNQTP